MQVHVAHEAAAGGLEERGELALGAELDLDSEGAEDSGGYAKEQGEDFLRRQRELMAAVVAESNVVITTAAIPGKKSPVLVTADMARGMTPGSVIVDLAAERGGNCELTKYGEVVDEGGVRILGPTNLPGDVPFHASQMFSKNLVNFLLNLIEDGDAAVDKDDEIVQETLVTRGGEVVNARVRELLGLATASTEGGQA